MMKSNKMNHTTEMICNFPPNKYHDYVFHDSGENSFFLYSMSQVWNCLYKHT